MPLAARFIAVRSLTLSLCWGIAWCCLTASPAIAQKLQLKDGRVLVGKIAKTAGVNENPEAPRAQAGEVAVQPIDIVEDNLRRVFISHQQVLRFIDQVPEPQAKIVLDWQNVARGGFGISSIGPSLGITPFDEFGRRIYKMQTAKGPLAVVQGITELTPTYARVEGLLGQPRPVVWDSRLATTSIPRETIAQLLKRAIPQDDGRARLQAVRFYIDAGRYYAASNELKQIRKDFPDMKDLDGVFSQLTQKSAARNLQEIELRKAAGQHQLVNRLLELFPAEEVAGETLQQVRELIAAYAVQQQRIDTTKENLTQMVKAIADPDHRNLAIPLIEELLAELNHNTIARMAPFSQLADDQAMTAEDKVALAISGWLMGADEAVTNLPLAVSLVKTRNRIHTYLNQSLPQARVSILDELRSLEGASVDKVAKLLAIMKPPMAKPEYAAKALGSFELLAPGQTEEGDFWYLVQLPPEYDPQRRYPTIIALNGAYNSPTQELDFWAGSQPHNEAGEPTGPRNGQAMRRGYITISIDWLKQQQYHYEYSAREHIAVLTCYRDACRKFHIDTDRIYLTGHGIGGDAAWDLAQSHPDLWAGVMPYVAEIARYGKYYAENAKYVPLYFVAGEFDGKKMQTNAALFDKYLRTRYDATVVEYLGRGHEPFHDEIQHAFEWMNRRVRQDAPEEFECSTLRPWDNFFWWIECHDIPPRWIVMPAAWTGRGVRATTVTGKKRADNRLLAKMAAERATIWLRPGLVDFDKPIRITINGRSVRGDRDAKPELEVLLEDARTRADRLRPFWAKVQWPE